MPVFRSGVPVFGGPVAAFSLQDIIRWESQPGKIGRRCPVGRESQEVQYPLIGEFIYLKFYWGCLLRVQVYSLIKGYLSLQAMFNSPRVPVGVHGNFPKWRGTLI